MRLAPVQFITAVFIFPILQYAGAQEIVSTAGGTISNSGTRVNWTIGECITESFSSDETYVTSGFNQPVIVINPTSILQEEEGVIRVFPNPTSDAIQIISGDGLSLRARLINSNGQEMQVIEKLDPTSRLSLARFESGIYTLAITDDSGKTNVYRIVKL
jgi:hypothetical protein